MEIQHMDARGGILMDLQRRSSNPFTRATDLLSKMIFHPTDHGPLAALLWYFEGENEYQSGDDVIDEIRAIILELDLQIAWQFQHLVEPPFSLVALADQTRSYFEKLQEARAFKKKR
jgi:hypothetical protein